MMSLENNLKIINKQVKVCYENNQKTINMRQVEGEVENHRVIQNIIGQEFYWRNEKTLLQELPKQY